MHDFMEFPQTTAETRSGGVDLHQLHMAALKKRVTQHIYGQWRAQNTTMVP